MLQRGRAQLSAEMGCRSRVAGLGQLASTGPRSIERGDLVTDTYRGVGGTAASTGPRSIERGDFGFGAQADADVLASTGPRSIERGDVPLPLFAGGAEVKLQRGRAQLSAEIRCDGGIHRIIPCFNGAALN